MGSVIAEFHPDSFEEFFTGPLVAHPSLAEDILKDFIRYKSEGVLPSYFGCDVPYTQPQLAFNVNLMHIHLCLPPDSFPDKLPSLTGSAERALRIKMRLSSMSGESLKKVNTAFSVFSTPMPMQRRGRIKSCATWPGWPKNGETKTKAPPSEGLAVSGRCQ